MPAAKKTATKTTPKKTATKKTSKKLTNSYKFDVSAEILPNLKPYIDAVKALPPKHLKDLPNQVQPQQFHSGRMALVTEKPMPIPSLIEMQIKSFEWFLTEGLGEILQEISPITDFSGTKLELKILNHSFDPPKYSPAICRRRNLSYEAPLKGTVQLINKETGEIESNVLLFTN